jgi:ribosome-associated translation inhibitor RaiA
MKCKPDYEFIVTSSNHIEIRKKNGEFLSSICCKECLPELETAIKKLKKQIKRYKEKKII